MNRADSLAFDFHKWLHLPYDIGMVLVRNELEHFRTFASNVDYLAHASRGPAGGGKWFCDFGIQLSRGFRALKAWMCIKEQGISKFGRLIQQNVEQAQYLSQMIQNEQQLELLAPVTLNIVCFRFIPHSTSSHPTSYTQQEIDNLNSELLLRIQERGIAVPSSTSINNCFAIRVAICNQRTVKKDFDVFIQNVLSIGGELCLELT